MYTYPQTTTPVRSMGLKGHPVSSLEEVRATGIDFDGSMFFFPDLAHKKIYTKQINIDGTATLNMYELQEMPQEMPLNTNSFVTREEFNAVIEEFRSLAKAQPKQVNAPLPAQLSF